ncbi:ABC transporter ATP-binding protein [Variovorax sp. 770b2]|uniref:ABC transporter ATP-binding protein n=1 Tax=Variovorax sp. 770b2 TaxID=1566271 RepID=UPI0008EEDEF6|nr:ABC transporter ATP-binding protein [Variovorax sp. 770b2]SFQ34895.1 Oligopeptide/dipeptide transporter, C-terminal region [Variovorax sp. 770b2]
MSTPLLEVEDLSLRFGAPGGAVHALDKVGFTLRAGETLGLVGESGSGKSVTALALAGLLDGGAHLQARRLSFQGRDLLAADGRPDAAAWQGLRGRRIGFVFQSPRRALHPLRSIGYQLQQVLRTHRKLSAAEARRAALGWIDRVGLADPERRMKAFAHQLSGGQCQRVMIALALAGEPELLIADEPTTGLDVSTQARVLDLVAGLARERGLATLLITHDLALAAQRCERIAVMHAGQLVETLPAGTLREGAAHPYTRQLLRATPQSVSTLSGLRSVDGALPDLSRNDLPACRFAGRCAQAEARCHTHAPAPTRHGAQHVLRCWVPARARTGGHTDPQPLAIAA